MLVVLSEGKSESFREVLKRKKQIELFRKFVRKCSGNFPEMFLFVFGNVQEYFRRISGKNPEKIRNVSGNCPEMFRKISGKCPEMFRIFVRFFFRETHLDNSGPHVIKSKKKKMKK